jgi:hypothetical protein
MTEEQNRAADNLLLLCHEHASEIDLAHMVDVYPTEVLRTWKAEQVRAAVQAGHGTPISADQAQEVARRSFGDTLVTFTGSTVNLGGQGGQAPGAGGGGGAAIGPGAVGGEGGSGGDVTTGWFRAEDLPDQVEIVVGRGGRGGEGDGEDGGASRFGDLLVGRGGKGGRAGKAGDLPELRIVRATAMLANDAEIRDGLLYVLGGGWDHYEVPRVPHGLVGSLVLTLDLAPGPVAGAIRLAIEMVHPGAEITELCVVERTLRIDPWLRPRVHHLVHIRHEVSVEGVWGLRASQDGEVIAGVDFEVRVRS